MINKLLKSKVFVNASWMVGCKIMQALIGLVISMLTARYLGPSNFGLINYAASIAAFFVPLMQLGLSNTLVQEIINSPENEGEVLGTSILMSVLSSFICILGVAAFSVIVNRTDIITITVCILYSLSLIAQAMELIQYWFQAKFLSKYTAMIMLFAYIAVALYQIYLLVIQKSVYWFAVIYSLQFGIISVGLLILYKRMNGQPLHFSAKRAVKLLSKSKYYIVSNMMVTIFAQSDRVMLKLMMGDAATGYYSAAIYCACITNFFFQAIMDAARPAIFQAKASSKEKFEKYITSLYSVITYLSLLQCIGMTVFAELIIYILYGADYFPAVTALQIGVWYTTFSYISVVRNIWILAENQQRYLWIINLCGAAANIILNAVLIPIYGINGAATASLITQFFACVFMNYLIKPLRRNNMLMMKGVHPKNLLALLSGK